jgi:hypothetical protein
MCAIAALAGGCGSDTTTTPITPTPVTFTESFTGLLNPASSATVSFVTQTGGKINATLAAIGPDNTQTVGFSLGTYNPLLNVCTIVFDNPAAAQSAVLSADASTTGYYCMRVYDNGTVAAAVANGSATAFTYTLTVTHP